MNREQLYNKVLKPIVSYADIELDQNYRNNCKSRIYNIIDLIQSNTESKGVEGVVDSIDILIEDTESRRDNDIRPVSMEKWIDRLTELKNELLSHFPTRDNSSEWGKTSVCPHGNKPEPILLMENDVKGYTDSRYFYSPCQCEIKIETRFIPTPPNSNVEGK